MPLRRDLTSAQRKPLVLAAVVSLACILSGCATTYTYSCPGHNSFGDENVSQLHVGMDSADVFEIFGQPDEELDARFGADVGDEWTGRVWIYFIERDWVYKYAIRYKKNVFVFYPVDGQLLLNNWEFES
jgi:hypothetical protein